MGFKSGLLNKRVIETALVDEDGTNKLTTTIFNNSDEDIDIGSFNIIFKDANGSEIVTTVGHVDTTIASNSNIEVINIIEEDLTQAVSIEYELID